METENMDGDLFWVGGFVMSVSHTDLTIAGSQ